jgi:hypothetical protein
LSISESLSGQQLPHAHHRITKIDLGNLRHLQRSLHFPVFQRAFPPFQRPDPHPQGLPHLKIMIVNHRLHHCLLGQVHAEFWLVRHH